MTDTPSEDVVTLAREMREGLEGVTPGPWYSSGHNVQGRFAEIGSPNRGIAKGMLGLDGLHIARCSPDNIRSLLDHIDALTTDRAASAARIERLERELATALAERDTWFRVAQQTALGGIPPWHRPVATRPISPTEAE